MLYPPALPYPPFLSAQSNPTAEWLLQQPSSQLPQMVSQPNLLHRRHQHSAAVKTRPQQAPLLTTMDQQSPVLAQTDVIQHQCHAANTKGQQSRRPPSRVTSKLQHAPAAHASANELGPRVFLASQKTAATSGTPAGDKSSVGKQEIGAAFASEELSDSSERGTESEEDAKCGTESEGDTKSGEEVKSESEMESGTESGEEAESETESKTDSELESKTESESDD